MEKLNIAELLRDCPTGMELDCTMYDNVYFDKVTSNMIKCFIKNDVYNTIYFYNDGTYSPIQNAKCVIFPKGKTTWEGFQRPFKDGDIVFYDDNIAIFKEWGDKTLYKTYVKLYIHRTSIDKDFPLFGKYIRKNTRLATKEEKEKLFKAIKDNGYRWDSKTKTLEKLIVPKFKVGDKIEKCGYRFTIVEVKEDYYLTKCDNKIPIENQDDFNLISNKFDINTLKPFESRVLVRNVGAWEPAFWGYYSKEYVHPFVVIGGNTFAQCVPYEENQHLLGTTDDCSSFFKIWE